MISLGTIDRTLAAYAARDPSQAAFVAPLRQLIADGADVRRRSTVPGHVTCGALVLNAEHKLLLIHHNMLGKWLQPGGHLEAGDDSLLAAALREAREETGLPSERLWTPVHGLGLPAQIDRHAIPANPKKNEPAHDHWDFRFVFLLRDTHAFELQLDEVSQARWADPEEAEPQIAAVVRQVLATL